MSKYRNKKTEVDGILFASQKEAARYSDLKLLERANEISDLRLQSKFCLTVNGMKVCDYVSDFEYYDRTTKQAVVEDCKGVKTPVYRLKKKLMKAVFGIEILET